MYCTVSGTDIYSVGVERNIPFYGVVSSAHAEGMIGSPKIAEAGVEHPQAADEDEIDPRRGPRAEFLSDGVDYAHGQ